MDAYLFYNILFSTDIVDKEIIKVTGKYSDMLVPTLKISNKEKFDKILVKYILLARDFYDPSNLFR